MAEDVVAVDLYLAGGDVVLRALAAQSRLLDADERERAARYHFDSDRLIYSAAHVLLRQALSRHVAIAPADWVFRRAAQGRPEIDHECCHGAVGWRFNLSHTRDLVCCALASDAAVGVDAQQHGAIDGLHEVARRFFSAPEAAALAALGADAAYPDTARDKTLAHFYRIWTLKEAFVKATGLGLGLGLGRFSFSFDQASPARIGVQLDEALERDWPAARWRCLALTLGGHSLALAVPTGAPVLVQPWLVCDETSPEEPQQVAASGAIVCQSPRSIRV